jgi:hypothetical protein
VHEFSSVSQGLKLMKQHSSFHVVLGEAESLRRKGLSMDEQWVRFH